MSAKSVTVALQPGIFQATLPDHRLMKPGINYVIDWETFKKISNGARQTVIQVVSINTAGSDDSNNAWMSSNANPQALINTILTTASATPTTTLLGGQAAQGMNSSLYQTASVGTVIDGAQDEKYMYIQLGDTNAVSNGDVLVWLDEVNRLVTRTRPTITMGKTTVGTFAGVAIAAIPASNYAWIQIMGECDEINTSTAIAAGAPLQVDASNAGSATSGLMTETYTLTTTSASAGTFILTWNGLSTSAIAWNAPTSTIQTDLRGLNEFLVTATVTGTSPGVMTVILPGTLPLTATFSLTGGSPTLVKASASTPTTVFGTATTASSSQVQGYIRSRKVKLPYKRRLNSN